MQSVIRSTPVVAALLSTSLLGCLDTGDALSGDDLGTSEQPLALSVGDVGWAWANDPTSNSYDASDNYAYTSLGGDVHISRLSVGRYRVVFEALGNITGNAQVTGYGDNSNKCKVESWGAHNPGIEVFVRCNDRGGTLVDSQFTVYYTEANSIPGGYLWSSELTGSHTAISTYSHNSAGLTNVVSRTSVGRYEVRLNGLNHDYGHVLVTAYGTDDAYCKPIYWGKDDGDTRVVVDCWKSDGTRVDSRFTLRYMEDTVGFFDIGYLWANKPAEESYQPNSNYRFNTLDATNSIKRTSTGHYKVHFPKIGWRATVMVSAYDDDSNYCKVDHWNSDDVDDEEGSNVYVECYDEDGYFVDSKFNAFIVTPSAPCHTTCNADGTICSRTCV
jgi:hypothetical protein